MSPPAGIFSRFFKSSPPVPYPTGFETLSKGEVPIAVDIVFVHGLRGHRRDTWSTGDVCWPEQLLANESALSHARILSYGYDANIVVGAGRASLASLFEHSMNLLNDLSMDRGRDAQDRDIIFIAHSLGGLVVKDALHRSEEVRSTHPRLASIVDSTRGIIFLGTPHRGSGMTSLAKVAAFAARVALHNPNDSLIHDLERDSQILDRIRGDFGRLLNKRTFTIWSFVEELPMRGIGRKVVERDSAVIDDAYENRGTIRADHVNMVKFSSSSDPGYTRVFGAIKQLLSEPSSGQSM